MAAPRPELVHPLPSTEIADWVRSMATAFLENPSDSNTDAWIGHMERDWDPERAWGVRDRDRWVGTLRTEPRWLTTPGLDDRTGDLAVDALTNVTVAASHRRQGWMSRMLGESLRAARARGDAVSVLIAAEWTIYGRFGYAPATLRARYRLDPRRPGAAVAGDPSRVRQVERDELRASAPTVFAAARRERSGQIDRPQSWWVRALGAEGISPRRDLAQNLFLHDGDDGPDGLLGWTATSGASLAAPDGRIEVSALAAVGRQAYADLWAYLTGIDTVGQVDLPGRPIDEPVRWLLGDGRALAQTAQLDDLWLCLLDVPAALAARSFALDGELVLEVSDAPSAVSVAGRYALRADGDSATCEPTGRPADLGLDQRTLASAYLGGFTFAQLAAGGLVRELRGGAIRRAGLLFSCGQAPWNATHF